MTDPTDSPPPPPPIQVRGNATPEQVAALLAVLTAASGGGDHPTTPAPTSRWASHAAAVRAPVTPGHGAWRHPHR